MNTPHSRRCASRCLRLPGQPTAGHSERAASRGIVCAAGGLVAAQAGEARLHLTAKLGEGPKEAAANAEEQLLRRAFAASNYNVAETARQLGLAREHVYYYLNKYGLRRPD